MPDGARENKQRIDRVEAASREAKRHFVQARQALKDSHCSESLQKATASIWASIELMCLLLDMDYRPPRWWLQRLVKAIPSQSVDSDYAHSFVEIAANLFHATERIRHDFD